MKRQKWSLTRTAVILLVFIAATLSGCVDAPEEPVDRTAIYVYQEGFGEEGDPEDIISNEGLYALVDESSAPDAEIKEVESGGDKKAPFGCKSVVALAKHWVVPIR